MEKTPLWLNLKKEYIDDNFQALQKYLKDCSSNKDKDSFYVTTVDLLRERVQDMLESLTRRNLFDDEAPRNEIVFNVNLLATYLLVDKDTELGVPAYVAFMSELRNLSPRYSDEIIRTTIQRLEHENVSSLGFTWSDLEKIGTDLFVNNLCKFARFCDPLKKPLIFDKFGTAFLTKEGFFLTHESGSDAKKLLKSGVDSMATDIGVKLRITSGEKLKHSEADNIKKMDEHIKVFIYSLYRVQKKEEKPKLKLYAEGDETTVRITNIDRSGNIFVETVDPRYQRVEGKVTYEYSSLMYYYTSTLHEFLHVGDVLPATIRDIDIPSFSFEKQMVRFFVEDNKRNEEEEGNLFLAKVIDANPAYCGWINSLGIAMYTGNSDEYIKGDYALLRVVSYGTGKQYGKINAEVVEPTEERFQEKEVRNECMRAFAESTPLPVIETVGEETGGQISPYVIKLLVRQMYEHQKTLLNPSDRYRMLANARVMAEIVGDELSASYLNFAGTYLLALVQFVNNQNVKDIQLKADEQYQNSKSTLIRLSVLELLKEYGREDNSEKLAQTISDFKESNPILAKLARLIQTANSMRGIASDAAINIIRREIIRTLSIETENEADFEAEGGIYLGVESGTQEFKTSMVYPPNNQMQPDEYVQNKNVLKGICAFLNTKTGGTLYLGVNDQGYIVGVENDMKFLRQESIDSYMRYVQDKAKQAFGVDVIKQLRIESLYDNRVVAIHIEPHPYRVVELDNRTYLRINAESREIREDVRQQLIARKVFDKKETAAAISLLQHSCTQKKCVILHNYSSSNSGNLSDRKVEAYDVRPEDGLVVCYDIDKSQIRVFNINRIGYVEILESAPWSHQSSHKPVNVDVFHMSGDNPIAVSLQLDLLAKNLLVEEYPRARDLLTQHKGDSNVWYFNGHVNDIKGIGRFYIGLANHIKILNAPELKKYVQEFRDEYLK